MFPASPSLIYKIIQHGEESECLLHKNVHKNVHKISANAITTALSI
jgi:hypothetical protein